jgi:hypothetical protein
MKQRSKGEALALFHDRHGLWKMRHLSSKAAAVAGWAQLLCERLLRTAADSYPPTCFAACASVPTQAYA